MKKGLCTQSLFVYDLCHCETGSKPAFAVPKPSSPYDSLLTAVSPCVTLETAEALEPTGVSDVSCGSLCEMFSTWPLLPLFF